MRKTGQGELLVVDDNEMNRDMLSRRLERAGYTVSLAEDGYQALDKIRANNYDLVLLDVMMPGLSGFDLLKMLRETYSIADLPIILATAKDRSEEIVEGLKLGANDYVTKPIDMHVLLARLDAHLQVKRLAQLKDEFLRIASHDLKNPLSSILMSAHLIHDMVPPGEVMPEDIYETVTFILRRSEEMQRIISDFLDFQAMADGKMMLELVRMDLNEVARNVVQDNMAYAQSKSINIQTELAFPLSPINADHARLSQVAQNLVGNAIKFCPPNSTIFVRTVQDAGSAVFEVCDSGPGLTDEDLAHMFMKYARLSNKPTGGEKSSGLGLAICKQMIELHGGEIGVRNNPDKGATFWFSIPAAE